MRYFHIIIALAWCLLVMLYGVDWLLGDQSKPAWQVSIYLLLANSHLILAHLSARKESQG